MKQLEDFIIETRGMAFARVLKEIGWMRTYNMNIEDVVRQNFKALGLDTQGYLCKSIFMSDPDVLSIVANHKEMSEHLGIFKTEFIIILSSKLGIGKNRTMNMLDDLISVGIFVVLPSSDSRHKLIQPGTFTDIERKLMAKRLQESFEVELFKDVDLDIDNLHVDDEETLEKIIISLSENSMDDDESIQRLPPEVMRKAKIAEYLEHANLGEKDEN